jgi:hypothetical protein
MKKLKSISFSILAILISIGFAACGGDSDADDTPKVLIENFSQGDLTFTEQSGEQSFSFTANSSWTVTVSSNGGDTSWCTVYPSSGEKGTQTVRVSTTANTSYDDRNATITLTSGTQTKSFVVTQKQKNALLLTSDKFEIDKAGGTITVEVKSNVSYTATIGEECKDWIKEGSGTRGLTTTTKIYTISPSEETDKREGTITFTDGTLSETVHVYQTGGYSVVLNQRSYVIDEKGGSITVELRSNCDYDVIMPDVDWIKEDKTRSMSSHTLYYNILANTTYDSREAIIIYKDKKDLVRDTLTVTQAQLNAVVLVDKTLTIGYKGGTIDAKVKSNVDYEVEIPTNISWIKVAPKTRGLVESTIQFAVEENSDDYGRSAEIFFKCKDGLNDTLNVKQSGSLSVITVDTLGTLVRLFEDIENPAKVKIIGHIYESELNTCLKDVCKYCNLSEAILYSSSGVVQKTINHVVDYSTNDKIETLILPNNITSIADKAFNGRDLLKTVQLPNGLTSIGKQSFYYCRNLSKITLPDNLTKIGDSAFANCSSLTEIPFPNSITEIGESAFEYCSNLTGISVPNNVTEIGRLAFSGCKGLTNVSLSNNLTKISDGIFSGCSGLESIIIPDNVTEISKSAFSSCKKLVDVTFPKSLKKIGPYAFMGCWNLSKVTFPNSLTYIGEVAFIQTSIKDVSFPSNISFIAFNSFEKIYTCHIYAKTPPETDDITQHTKTPFSVEYEKSSLYIPKGCREAYKAWAEEFKDVYEMEE